MTVRANNHSVVVVVGQAFTTESSSSSSSSSSFTNYSIQDTEGRRGEHKRLSCSSSSIWINSNNSNSNQHRGIMVQCFASGNEGRRGSAPYIRRIEKVKFGVPVAEAFSHDIPATLLVLLLKVNKQGPAKRDIWRAPGNQAHVRKLIHVMQHGRLVNIENFSVYTAASVIKKFLSKIPGGIFGSNNEERLFELLNFDDPDKQREAFCRVVSSLPVPSQHLLVLLIGTFRLIADAADTCGASRMSPDAIGVSVAPSLFHSCIHDGQRAKMEDIARFHMASKVLSFLVQNFGFTNLFPRDNYEFYARITGRTLRVDANWHFTFQYPSRAFSQPDVVVTPEHDDGASEEPFRRLANSAELTTTAVSLDELKRINKLAESTKSLSYLEWVHERQTQRMQSRSEWFLSPDHSMASSQKQPSSTSAQIETSVTSSYLADRHGSLPAGGGGMDDMLGGAASTAAAGPSGSSPRPSVGGPSPHRQYRRHIDDPPRHRTSSVSSGGINYGSPIVSPSKMSIGRDSSSNSQNNPIEGIVRTPRSPLNSPDSPKSPSAPKIIRENWSTTTTSHYVRSGEQPPQF